MSTKTRYTPITLPFGNAYFEWVAASPPAAGIFPHTGLTPEQPRSFHSYEEEITSHTGTNGRFRPCYHIRYDSRIHLFKDQEYLIPPPVANMVLRPMMGAKSTFTDVDVNKSLLINANNGFGLSNNDWNALDTRALAFMLPSMNQGVSLVNFLLELKDFRFLFKREVGTTLGRARRFLRALLVQNRRKELPYRELSKLVLFKEFALDPFRRDIESIYKGLKTLDARLEQLKRRARTKQSRRFTAALNELYTLPNVRSTNSGTQYWVDYQNSIEYSDYWKWIDSPVYNATCRYVYELQDIDAVSLRAKALLDTLGVRKDISIIWNAIPFSFVVDWFVNVSKFLEQFASNNIGMRIEVIDFCSSIKSSLQHKVYTQHKCIYGGLNQLGPPRTVIDATYRVYDRRTGVPNMNLALETSGLSPKEAFLSAALVGANVPRNNRS